MVNYLLTRETTHFREDLRVVVVRYCLHDCPRTLGRIPRLNTALESIHQHG
jgi:hypothetical protein